jgi:murein DD-endopeptidase MepM/ murein hydrolase activator NlpD
MGMNKLLLLALAVCLPLRHISLTSPFGNRIHPVTGKYNFHDGVDLRARSDTVFAILPGTIFGAGYHPLLGTYIRLGHGDLQCVYGHLSRLFVIAGDTVSCGQPIGVSGATGRVTGEHLHLSITWRGTYIDPLQFLLTAINNLNNNKENNK